MSNTTPFIQNLFTSRDNNANSATYVGQQDRIWYDSTTGFRVSDGNTPGGTPAVVATTSANIGNLVIFDTTISTIQANANINLVTNGVGNINVTGAFVTANTGGSTVIETLQNGTINFYVPTIGYDSAIDIIGTADGTQQYPQNQGVLLHLTGQDSLPGRIYSDGVNNYAAFIGRRYNGNATAPTQVLAGQTISRYGGTPYGNAGWPTISTARVDFVALEDQTATNQGTSIQFYTTPVGTASSTPSITVASTGITNAANVIPILDQAYNLGTPTLRWENVYAGQGGLWLADSVTDVETQLSVTNGTFYINGVQSIALGNLVIANTTLETSNPAFDINIGNIGDSGNFVISRPTQIDTQNLSNRAALTVNASLQTSPATPYPGTLIHGVAEPGTSARIVLDAFGSGVYGLLAGRNASGNSISPAPTGAGNVMMRVVGSGYGTSGFNTAGQTAGGAIDFVAAETWSDTNKGTTIQFRTTAIGANAWATTAAMDSTGITVPGVTFSGDSSYQTTAGIPLTQKGAGLGVATLDSSGYLSAAQIPPSIAGGVNYQGAWNASTNTNPAINTSGQVNFGSGYVNPVTGWEFSIAATGTIDIGAGSQIYDQGGFIIYSGTVWTYVPPPAAGVVSLAAGAYLAVNQSTGAVTVSANTATAATANTIVVRDASGNFSANTITATLSGAATSATTAATVTTAAQPAITSVGTLTALTVSGNASGGNLSTAGQVSATGNITGGNVLTGGVISATGNITGGNLSGTNIVGTLATATQTNITSLGTLTSLSATGNINGGNLRTAGLVTATGNITGGNIVTAGIVSATGNITGNYFIGNGSQLTGIASYGNSNVATFLAAFGSNTISTTGTVTAGNITGGNLLTSGLISATGNITGNVYIGNGAGLTNLIGANVTGTVANATYAVSANASTYAGTVTTAAQPNITSVGILSSVSVTANVTGGNILTAGQVSATGNITAAYHIGNGSQLTSLTGSNVTGTVANATYAVTAGTVTTAAQPNITSVGTLTSLSSSGNVTASYFLGNGSALTSITGANVTGVVANATYAVSSGSATTAGTVTTAAQPNITSVGILSSVSVTGNATSGNVLTGGVVSATGNITGNYFIGNGSQLTGITSYGNANVNTLLASWGSNTISTTGTITAGNITGANSIVSGYETVTGNITGGNILTAGQVSATGNITAGNVNVSASGTLTTPHVVFNDGGVRALTGNTTVTLDFSTDSMVSLTNPTNTVTITLANYTAGAIIRFIYSSVTARNIDMGVAGPVNSTTGTANITGTGVGALYGGNQAVILTYYCVGGTAATTYVAVSYV